MHVAQGTNCVCRQLNSKAKICVQDAVESKKRETMLVGLKQTQGHVGVLEESLTRVQLELERVSFALQAKTGAFRDDSGQTDKIALVD